MTFPKAFVRDDANDEAEEVPKTTTDETTMTPPITCLQDLTTDSFSRLLQHYYQEPTLRVDSFQTQTLTNAILSNVVQVDILLSNDTITATPMIPTSYIVKFLKESLPLKEMFRVEQTFYQEFARDVVFFQTPTFLYASPTCIVLEKVTDAYPQPSLLEGCDYSDIPILLSGLAQFHAHYWHRTEEALLQCKLSSSPGMGSALNGLNKEHMFRTCYERYTERLYNSNNTTTSTTHRKLPPLDKFTCHCQDLSLRKLREIHEAVHNHYRPTLIHGDFHVGNLLKQEKNPDSSTVSVASSGNNNSTTTSWYLLDWATCGVGNPLMDVIFFLVVSCGNQISSDDFFNLYLPHYYQQLVHRNPSIATELTLDSYMDLCRDCLIDEFLILVCYDETSRDLIQKERPETRAFFEEHFLNVNSRMATLLLSDYMTGYPLPPHKTRKELELEQQQEPEWRQHTGEGEGGEGRVITEI